jgi:hypothetical protein
MLTLDPVPVVRQGWTTRHPLTAFLVLVFGIAYPPVATLILAVRGVLPGGALIARLPIPPDEVAGLVLTLAGLLPAALLTDEHQTHPEDG